MRSTWSGARKRIHEPPTSRPRGHRFERLVREVGERGARPERECLGELLSRRLSLAAGATAAAVIENALEPFSVQLLRLEPCARVRAALRPERPSGSPICEAARRAPAASSRPSAETSRPSSSIEFVGGDDLVRVEEGDGKERVELDEQLPRQRVSRVDEAPMEEEMHPGGSRGRNRFSDVVGARIARAARAPTAPAIPEHPFTTA